MLRVVDDGAYEFAAPDVISLVGSYFHFEVAEPSSDGFFREAGHLLIGIAYRRVKKLGAKDRKAHLTTLQMLHLRDIRVRELSPLFPSSLLLLL